MTEQQHTTDQYGNVDARSENEAGVQAPIPAATVILARDHEAEMQVLMLRKNSKIAFGGMWVFPGGKIDAADHEGAADELAAARQAAARESMEEAGVQLQPDEFAYFAHWTPPPGPQKRFATYFFAAGIEAHADIAIDDGEIKDYRWIAPQAALDLHAKGEIDLVPPTWVTLYHLTRHTPSAALLAHLQALTARVYQTRVAKNVDGVRVAMWAGDAGYEPWDADVEGERHRLAMAPSGFVFENTVVEY